MPGKRARKDSERSTGSVGTTSSNSGRDGSPCRGAGSTSSGSLVDENENTCMKSCCFPSGCPLGEDTFTDENLMVKVICNYDSCKMSQFMHVECFSHWEEGILNYLRSHGRARSWSDKQRRQNLWTKKGYDLAYRACQCKCRHGHLRKDLEWIPQASSSAAETDGAANKKKNRKKHKDLPILGSYNGLANKTKSKPIPSSKGNRMRHSSASSIVSVDQGYISASPGSSEIGSFMFSPPAQHHRTGVSFPYPNVPGNRPSNAIVAPSTSPLLEVPDGSVPSSPELTPSPNSDTSPDSSVGVFTPPLSPESSGNKVGGNLLVEPMLEASEVSQSYPMVTEEQRKYSQSNIQAMSTLIDNLWRRNKQITAPESLLPQQNCPGLQASNRFDPGLARNIQIEQALTRLRLDHAHPTLGESFPPNTLNFPRAPFNSPNLSGNFMEKYHHGNFVDNGLYSMLKTDNFQPGSFGNYNSNAQVLLALRQKEQKEIEKRELHKYILSAMSPDETRTQVISLPPDRSRPNSLTEVRLVPMRSTTFLKRYDFSLFEGVLARQHINPYHIKMEGEGYGSDDLRNFILACLSKEKCSQMNCVVCGMDLPVYNHFPLVDGTMFLSPERNERSTRNCFKIKVEGKFEYVHAACMRCMEGLHNIVCRLCNQRWEGTYHQLGTLYMYDIFAARPCCQKRLCCKKCGGVIVDIRQGLTYFSDYSTQKTCPHCHSVDYHCVHPITTYQLMGLVFS